MNKPNHCIDANWWRATMTLGVNAVKFACSELLTQGRFAEVATCIEAGLPGTDMAGHAFNSITTGLLSVWPQGEGLMAAWIADAVAHPERMAAIANDCVGVNEGPKRFALEQLLIQGYDGEACWTGRAASILLREIRIACTGTFNDALPTLELLLRSKKQQMPALPSVDRHKSLGEIIVESLLDDEPGDDSIDNAGGLLALLHKQCLDAPRFLQRELDHQLLTDGGQRFNTACTIALLLSGVEPSEAAKAAICTQTYRYKDALDKPFKVPIVLIAGQRQDALAVQLLQRLHVFGADLDCLHDNVFGTPLYYAVMGGNVASVRLLLDLGADPKRGHDLFKTPLTVAIDKTVHETGREILAMLQAAAARRVAAQVLTENQVLGTRP